MVQGLPFSLPQATAMQIPREKSSPDSHHSERRRVVTGQGLPPRPPQTVQALKVVGSAPVFALRYEPAGQHGNISTKADAGRIRPDNHRANRAGACALTSGSSREASSRMGDGIQCRL